MSGQTIPTVGSVSVCPRGLPAGQGSRRPPSALPGLLSFMALRGFTSALGRAGPVMTISLAGAAANFVLNYALIHQWLGLPNLGLMGIGLVTAIVRGDVADAQAGGAAGEPAVGHQQHVLAETRALDGAGDRQHLAHAGPALGPLVANDNHIIGFDLSLLHCRESILLAIEHASRAFMN